MISTYTRFEDAEKVAQMTRGGAMLRQEGNLFVVESHEPSDGGPMWLPGFSPEPTQPTQPSDPEPNDDGVGLGLDFLTAGNAIFTVANPGGKHYTYRVSSKEVEGGRTLYFVGLLTGPDNTGDYTYIGMLDDASGSVTMRLTRGSKMDADSVPVKVFGFALRVIQGMQLLPVGYTIQHSGRCGRCGRTLTEPESLRTGIGPVCRGMM